MENKVLISYPMPAIVWAYSYTHTITGRYEKDPARVHFARLPEWLKVEYTQTNAPKQNGAYTIIHGPKKAGKYSFYTGLRETGWQNWQYGNDYEFRQGKKVNSLCLFRWMDGDRRLMVYYFTGWYFQDRAKLEKIIRGIISNIQKNETAG
ncbi:MAG: hypothetical protein JNL57_04210 [Bacteroidetes bacterium]|nr:hypothetical protein [Bacteroidota bacterium]